LICEQSENTTEGKMGSKKENVEKLAANKEYQNHEKRETQKRI
jgi:hypothetical protein